MVLILNFIFYCVHFLEEGKGTSKIEEHRRTILKKEVLGAIFFKQGRNSRQLLDPPNIPLTYVLGKGI